MTYDPFSRGPHPVGVRSLDWKDADRERALPVELWYPAHARHAGQDLDPESQDRFRLIPAAPETPQAAVRDADPLTGTLPVVLFSHGFSGHRRQTTHLCTHLASHGYVVAAPDHVGNTMGDMLALVMNAQQSGERPDGEALMHGFIADRPADMSFVLDGVLAEAQGDAERVGITGHSFGGWTTLAVADREPRIKAAAPLAPAGGPNPLAEATNPLSQALRFERTHEIPVLYIVADRDTLLPLEGMRVLLERTPQPRRMLVLRDADHMHFCDHVEQIHEMFRMMAGATTGGIEGLPDFGSVAASIPPIAQLLPGEPAYACLRSSVLAHFDACLRGNTEAREFLGEGLPAKLAAHGATVHEIE